LKSPGSPTKGSFPVKEGREGWGEEGTGKREREWEGEQERERERKDGKDGTDGKGEGWERGKDCQGKSRKESRKGGIKE
jgi:hypothetical protein